MSIESVQARIGEIINRIGQKTAKIDMDFQAVFGETLGSDSAPESAEVSAGTGQAGLLQNNATTTGRYCSKCGMPEVASIYAQYTGAVDTGDGMLEKAAPYMDIIEEASSVYGVPVNLILGVIKAESDFDPKCVSGAGAKGLMQIMPENAAEFGVTDVYDPRQNIFCGVDEIARHLKTYSGDMKLALAAYNTGPGNVAKRNVTSSNSPEYLNIPQSVRDYADRVLRYAGLGQ
ncbi:lytic transglycosylase domain-containing protein [Christensenella intestinihominis]|uniref:lytic transglycosylase domain-containing protein n=1 Tax=Christensenella intestinihominis TaxID=1851429 RepID=UPI00082B879E|nr:lytic transglycosylase domain-containing protein [Christensenella intestinihominis]